MRIEADSVLPFSRDAVFKAYRDDLPKVVEFLPNVREIECKKRETAGPVTTLFNVVYPLSVRQYLTRSSKMVRPISRYFGSFVKW